MARVSKSTKRTREMLLETRGFYVLWNDRAIDPKDLTIVMNDNGEERNFELMGAMQRIIFYLEQMSTPKVVVEKNENVEHQPMVQTAQRGGLQRFIDQLKSSIPSW